MSSTFINTCLANVTATTVHGVLVTRTTHRIALGELDDAITMAYQAEPLSGYYDLICHGNRDGQHLVAFVNGGRKCMTAQQIAPLILAQTDYTGQPIRLLSCWPGLHDDGFAAQLDQILGAVGVLACNNEIGVYDSGELSLPDEAIWRLFIGGQIIDNPAVR